MARRPLIVVPGRFSESASALRYAALVNARALLAAVWRAGGEPLTVLPADPADVADRLRFADGVLLPGGGDVSPARYRQDVSHTEVYDVDDLQDEFDLAVTQWALVEGVPLLAVCRGMQVVNVALGGTLEQHMEVPHRHVRHRVRVVAGSALADVVGTSPEVSCYHHQRVHDVGRGLHGVATCDAGGVEALELDEPRGFFLAIQWHPEDTAAADPTQAALFEALVRAAR